MRLAVHFLFERQDFLGYLLMVFLPGLIWIPTLIQKIPYKVVVLVAIGASERISVVGSGGHDHTLWPVQNWNKRARITCRENRG